MQSSYNKLEENSPDSTPSHDDDTVHIHDKKDHICITIPKPFLGGFFWDKEVVKVDKNNLAQLLFDLQNVQKQLENRFNNANYVSQIIHDSGVLLIALLQLTKVSVNKVKGTAENNTDMFNVSMDAVCIAIPMVTSFISKVVNYIKNNAEQFKKDAEASEDKIQLRV